MAQRLQLLLLLVFASNNDMNLYETNVKLMLKVHVRDSKIHQSQSSGIKKGVEEESLVKQRRKISKQSRLTSEYGHGLKPETTLSVFSQILKDNRVNQGTKPERKIFGIPDEYMLSALRF